MLPHGAKRPEENAFKAARELWPPRSFSAENKQGVLLLRVSVCVVPVFSLWFLLTTTREDRAVPSAYRRDLVPLFFIKYCQLFNDLKNLV